MPSHFALGQCMFKLESFQAPCNSTPLILFTYKESMKTVTEEWLLVMLNIFVYTKKLNQA